MRKSFLFVEENKWKLRFYHRAFIWNEKKQMNPELKKRIIRFVIYILVGFACAYAYHQFKK